LLYNLSMGREGPPKFNKKEFRKERQEESGSENRKDKKRRRKDRSVSASEIDQELNAQGGSPDIFDITDEKKGPDPAEEFGYDEESEMKPENTTEEESAETPTPQDGDESGETETPDDEKEVPEPTSSKEPEPEPESKKPKAEKKEVPLIRLSDKDRELYEGYLNDPIGNLYANVENEGELRKRMRNVMKAVHQDKIGKTYVKEDVDFLEEVGKKVKEAYDEILQKIKRGEGLPRKLSPEDTLYFSEVGNDPYRKLFSSVTTLEILSDTLIDFRTRFRSAGFRECNRQDQNILRKAVHAVNDAYNKRRAEIISGAESLKELSDDDVQYFQSLRDNAYDLLFKNLDSETAVKHEIGRIKSRVPKDIKAYSKKHLDLVSEALDSATIAYKARLQKITTPEDEPVQDDKEKEDQKTNKENGTEEVISELMSEKGLNPPDDFSDRSAEYVDIGTQAIPYGGIVLERFINTLGTAENKKVIQSALVENSTNLDAVKASFADRASVINFSEFELGVSLSQNPITPLINDAAAFVRLGFDIIDDLRAQKGVLLAGIKKAEEGGDITEKLSIFLTKIVENRLSDEALRQYKGVLKKAGKNFRDSSIPKADPETPKADPETPKQTKEKEPDFEIRRGSTVVFTDSEDAQKYGMVAFTDQNKALHRQVYAIIKGKENKRSYAILSVDGNVPERSKGVEVPLEFLQTVEQAEAKNKSREKEGEESNPEEKKRFTKYKPKGLYEKRIVEAFLNEEEILIKRSDGTWNKASIRSLDRQGVVTVRWQSKDGESLHKTLGIEGVVSWLKEKEEGSSPEGNNESEEAKSESEPQEKTKVFEDNGNSVLGEKNPDYNPDEDKLGKVRSKLRLRDNMEQGYDPSESFEEHIPQAGAETYFAESLDSVFGGTLTESDLGALYKSVEDNDDLNSAVGGLAEASKLSKELPSAEKFLEWEDVIQKEVEGAQEKQVRYNLRGGFLSFTKSFFGLGDEREDIFKEYDRTSKFSDPGKLYAEEVRFSLDKKKKLVIDRIESARRNALDTFQGARGQEDSMRAQEIEVEIENKISEVNSYFEGKEKSLGVIERYPQGEKGYWKLLSALPGGKSVSSVLNKALALPFQVMSKISFGLIDINTPARNIEREHKKAKIDIGAKRNKSKSEYLADRIKEESQLFNIEKSLYRALSGMHLSVGAEQGAEKTERLVSSRLGSLLEIVSENDDAIKVLRQRLGLRRINHYIEMGRKNKEGAIKGLADHKRTLLKIRNTSDKLYLEIGGSKLVDRINETVSFMNS
jgi:hypothetical protein